jgi:hypothetical protein
MLEAIDAASTARKTPVKTLVKTRVKTGDQLLVLLGSHRVSASARSEHKTQDRRAQPRRMHVFW